jgi:hypothetical protein
VHKVHSRLNLGTIHLLSAKSEVWRARGYWNFRFDRAAIAAALRSDQYHIQGLPDTLAVRHADDLARLQRLATAIVRQLFERTYRQQQPGAPVLAPLAVEPKQYSREEPDAH